MPVTEPPKKELTEDQKSLRRAAIKTGAILAGYGGLLMYARSGKGAAAAGKILPNAADRKAAEKAAKAAESATVKKVVEMPGAAKAPVAQPVLITSAQPAPQTDISKRVAKATPSRKRQTQTQSVEAKQQNLLAARFLAARLPRLRQFGDDDYVNSKGRYTDQLKAVAGLTQAHKRTADGRLQEVDVPIHSAAVLKSAMNKGAKVYKYGQRSTGMIADIHSTLKGEVSPKDEWGRKQKREWDKPWFRNAQGAAIGGAALLGGALVLKKNPALRAKLAGGVAAAKEKIADATHLSAIQRTAKLLSRRGRLRMFDETAANWDVRDARGRSARVFAPGSKERERRDKKWYERIGNQRKIMAGAAAVALTGGGVAGWMLRKKYGGAPKIGPITGTSPKIVAMPDLKAMSARLRSVRLFADGEKKQGMSTGKKLAIVGGVALAGGGLSMMKAGAPLARIVARDSKIAGKIREKVTGAAIDPAKHGKFISDYLNVSHNMMNTGVQGKVIGKVLSHARENPAGAISKKLGGEFGVSHYQRFRAGPLQGLSHWHWENEASMLHGLKSGAKPATAAQTAKVQAAITRNNKGKATLDEHINKRLWQHGDNEHEALAKAVRATGDDTKALVAARHTAGHEETVKAVSDHVAKSGATHEQAIQHIANEEHKTMQQYFRSMATHKASAAKMYSKKIIGGGAALAVGGVGAAASIGGVGTAAGTLNPIASVDNNTNKKKTT
ncbi:MAG: hypothetical protein WCO60_18425 [Verrucomicrobiota bacterium]